ncbi:MAG: FAD-dependent oxidoreductase [Firmicutes bacterium]|nr:FAD-dependent oxidoreductase [Bacillota bacterium]
MPRRDVLRFAAAAGTFIGVGQIPARLARAAFVGGMPRTEAFDVVVIGTGMAGLTAAREAAEQGARVAVLEKQPRPLFGGNSLLAGGIFCMPMADTPEARQAFVDEIMKKSGYRTDKALTEDLANRVLGDIDWLVAHGVELTDPAPQAPYKVHARTCKPAMYKGMPKALGTLMAAAEGNGVHFYFSTKASELLVDAAGRVVGVRALTSKGFVDFRARATIIATGGFAGNRQMLEQWVGPTADEGVVRGVKWATGDGHRMASEVGALLIHMGGTETVHVAATHPKNPASANPFAVLPYTLGINKLGRRYVDESLGYVAHGKAVMNQPGAQAALVFDQGVADMNEGRAVLELFASLGIEVLKAPTLEELAAKIEVPADALRETVEAFNAAVSNGQALDPDGTPIKGLYAAGECVGGYYLDDYVGGASLSRCLVDGRVAGRNAAAERA